MLHRRLPILSLQNLPRCTVACVQNKNNSDSVGVGVRPLSAAAATQHAAAPSLADVLAPLLEPNPHCHHKFLKRWLRCHNVPLFARSANVLRLHEISGCGADNDDGPRLTAKAAGRWAPSAPMGTMRNTAVRLQALSFGHVKKLDPPTAFMKGERTTWSYVRELPRDKKKRYVDAWLATYNEQYSPRLEWRITDDATSYVTRFLTCAAHLEEHPGNRTVVGLFQEELSSLLTVDRPKTLAGRLNLEATEVLRKKFSVLTYHVVANELNGRTRRGPSLRYLSSEVADRPRSRNPVGWCEWQRQDARSNSVRDRLCWESRCWGGGVLFRVVRLGQSQRR